VDIVSQFNASDFLFTRKIAQYGWEVIAVESSVGHLMDAGRNIRQLRFIIVGGFVIYIVMVWVGVFLLFVTRRTSRALNIEHSNLQSIFNVAQVGLILVNAKGEVVQVNRALESMTGRVLEAGVGARPGEMLCCVSAVELKHRCGEGPHCSKCSIRMLINKVFAEGVAASVREISQVFIIEGRPVVRWLEVAASPIDGENENLVLLSLIDISQYKETERVIRLAEERAQKGEAWWRSLIQEVPAVSMVLGLDGVIQLVNRPFAGISVSDLVGNPLAQFLNVRDSEALGDSLKRVFGHKESVIHESHVLSDLGETVWYENHIGPVETDGKVSGAVCLAFDVTQRKQGEDLLRKMSLAVKYSPVAVAITDRFGKIEYVNPKFTAFTGYRIDEVSGQVLRILREGELPDDRREELFQMIHSGYNWQGEYEEKAKDGTKYFEMITISPVLDSSGQVINFIVLKEDITERHNVQKQKEADLNFLKHLLDAIPSPVFYKDLEGTYQGCNKAFEVYIGRSRSQIVGKTIYEISSRELAEKQQAYDEAFYWQGVGEISETKVRYFDGTDHDVVLFKSTLRDPQGQVSGLVGVMLDISDRKLMEEELRASRNMLVKALEEVKAFNVVLEQTQDRLVQQEKLAAIGFLAAGVAHEINNPLGFVNGNLQSLGEYANALVETLALVIPLTDAVESGDMIQMRTALAKLKDTWQKSSVDYILNDLKGLLAESQEGLNRISMIVMGLKGFSRTDREVMVTANINEILDGVLAIVWNQLKYHIDLVKEYSDLPSIECNPQQLGQVFLNLLVNAEQAISERGVITLRTCVRDNAVIIEVKDTGKGIPVEVMSKIFDPFFTTKEPGKGTGLGLSISYDIVRKHGGRIDVESVVDHGAVFKVTIPLQHQPNMPVTIK